jgi:hypothetical protein
MSNLGLVLWWGWVLVTAVACTTPDSPPTAEPAPTNCFPDAVFTPADMQARVDCHPAEYKMEIDGETAVLFAYPDPILDWVGPIFIIHIPSVSETVLNVDGSIIYEDYKSESGQAAIAQVLNSPPQMERILERVIETEGVGP